MGCSVLLIVAKREHHERKALELHRAQTEADLHWELSWAQPSALPSLGKFESIFIPCNKPQPSAIKPEGDFGETFKCVETTILTKPLYFK